MSYYYCQINANGSVEYRNSSGLLHREDGPALIYPYGDVEYYQNGLLHRLDGPAKIIPGYEISWYFEGKLHRSNGPALEDHDHSYWYFHGENITHAIDQWMHENNIRYPFDESAKILFRMTWL